MLVKALKLGFYGGKRVKEGTVFDMADEILKDKEGKFKLPSWVELLDADKEVKAKTEVKVDKNFVKQEKKVAKRKAKVEEEPPAIEADEFVL